jgi:NADP-dependent 3-hydroxy acid dehydrogenase YdfG
MITEGLLAHGIKVYIASRDKDALEQFASKMAKYPSKCVPIAADLSKESDITNLVKQIEAHEERNNLYLILLRPRYPCQ